MIAAIAISLLPLAAALPAGVHAGEADGGGIGLTIRNELPFERSAEGITCGVPLPKGFAAAPGGAARESGGYRIDGWVHARGPKGSVAASIREFRQKSGDGLPAHSFRAGTQTFHSTVAL